MSITHVILAIGVLVIVPLGLRLTRTTGAAPIRRSLPAGVLAVVAIALPPSLWAGLLGLPWVLLAALKTFSALAAAKKSAAPLLDRAASVAAPGYWTVGGVWLTLDSVGADPVGVGAVIVTLTAVHFHFAGFAATTVLFQTRQRNHNPTPTQRRAATVAIAGILTGPSLVAIGFATYRPAQIVGATVLSVGLWCWSLAAAAAPTQQWSAAARNLWSLARCSVLVGMPLGLWWAVGSVTGIPAPTIPVMAMTHGIVQGIGFSLGALLALNLTLGERLSHPCGSMGTVRTHVR